MSRFLNIGCGIRYSEDPRWVNVDTHADSDRVMPCDLSGGLPFPDGSFDAVYSSHVLEHFCEAEARALLRDCHRVIRPGGLIRIVVPDLEGICRLYLEALDHARTGDAVWRSRYEWVMLELFDQVIRTRSGGEMARHLLRPDLADRDFIVSRIGNVARSMVDPAARDACRVAASSVRKRHKSVGERARSIVSSVRRAAAASLLSERERIALKAGLFRAGGEVHQWMYDEYSLGKLLEEEQFERPNRRSASDSGIRGWGDFHLDVGRDGFEHAPNSLYMEGVKPLD